MKKQIPVCLVKSKKSKTADLCKYKGSMRPLLEKHRSNGKDIGTFQIVNNKEFGATACCLYL